MRIPHRMSHYAGAVRTARVPPATRPRVRGIVLHASHPPDYEQNFAWSG